MVSKKQLAALARGRAIRKENIRKNKTSKRKTKAEYKNEEKKIEKPKEKTTDKATYKEPTKIILYNGEPIEVPISKLPKGKNRMKKLGKYAKNIAIAAATLGALGYGAYNSKKLYDKYLHYPVDLGKEALKSGYKLWMDAQDLGKDMKDEWNKYELQSDKYNNVIKMLYRRGKNWYKSTSDKVSKWVEE